MAEKKHVRLHELAAADSKSSVCNRIYLGVIDRDFENFEHEFPIWTAILFFVSIWSVLDIRHAERVSLQPIRQLLY